MINNVEEALVLFQNLEENDCKKKADDIFKGKVMIYDGDIKEEFIYEGIDVESWFVNGEYPPECCNLK